MSPEERELIKGNRLDFLRALASGKYPQVRDDEFVAHSNMNCRFRYTQSRYHYTVLAVMFDASHLGRWRNIGGTYRTATIELLNTACAANMPFREVAKVLAKRWRMAKWAMPLKRAKRLRKAAS